jgi:hypothetical protein
VVGKEIAVKKYVVRLSAEERAQLDELIRKGKQGRKRTTDLRTSSWGPVRRVEPHPEAAQL